MSGVQQDTPEYWEALGRFVQQFSRTEYRLSTMLWQLPSDDERIGREIFAGQRSVEQVRIVRHLYQLRELPNYNVLDEALTRLRLIADVRNTILHHGIWFPPGADLHPYVTKRHLSRSGKKSGRSEDEDPNADVCDEYVVTRKTLDDMRSDLERIAAILVLHSPNNLKPDQQPSVEASYGPISRLPWLYTPQKQRERQRPAHSQRKAQQSRR